MVEFSNLTGLDINLVYYPPYHSKYNLIERCWGALERHWNGAILNSISTAIGWASTMTWKGIKPTINIIKKIYEKGITLSKKEMRKYQDQIQRSAIVPKWDVTIISYKNMGC
jgi:transposase